jgi:hypothetical protein
MLDFLRVICDCRPLRSAHFQRRRAKKTLFESSAKLSEFCYSTGLKESEDADAGGRIAVLKKAKQLDHAIVIVIVMLQNKLRQLSTDFGFFAGEVSTLRSAAGM